jgi:hypothetical protein
MRKLLFLLALLSVMMQSCDQKDYLEPQPGTPAFSLEGLRNGQPFSLAAGVDGLVQTASLERNKYGVMEWQSKFVTASCASCDPVFSFTLNDRQGMTQSDCANLELFNSSMLDFATEQSTSGFMDCELGLSSHDAINNMVFFANNADQTSANSFTFQSEGVQEVSATYALHTNSPSVYNTVTIRQWVFAGNHYHVSAPFLYEIQNDGGDETEGTNLTLFPTNDPELRFDHWRINGVVNNQQSIPLEIDNSIAYTIEAFYTNDAEGLSGFYSLHFDHGFPVENAPDDDHDVHEAPFIHVDWASASPNFEKVILEYREGGKVYTSATPLNNSTDAQFKLLSYSAFTPGLQGNSAITLQAEFSATLVELGNETNTITFSNCKASLGFVVPQ